MAEMETDKKVLSFHRLHRKSPETRINAGFPSSIFLLKLQTDSMLYK